MFLKQTPQKNGIHLSIVRTYHDPVSKTTRTKTVKSLGYLEKLKELYTDPVAHFKAEAARMNEAEKAEKAQFVIKLTPDERLSSKTSAGNRMNLGYAVLSKVFHDLKLDTFFKSRDRRFKSEFSMNPIIKSEIFSRILCPGSKKHTFELKDRYFERSDYSLDDVYRCLSQIAVLEDELKLWLHESITALLGKRKTEVCYYDVTNYYFEIDQIDELRKKGVGKEHRPDPIVQMGLLTDANGLPLTYKLFAGNTNDCETYRPTVGSAKLDFNLERTVIVADKGLNTSDNIAFELVNHDGYIFSQTVRGANSELKAFVLNQTGYRAYGVDGYRIKSRIYPRILHVSEPSGKKRVVDIDEKQIIFYSPDYARRAKHERAEAVAKARDMVKNPVKYNRLTACGAAKYVDNLVYDKKTGEILPDSAKLLSFNETKLREEEALDGYYAIVTSELDESDERIIELYKELWRIEESFKITKSTLNTRPVYLSTIKHINAHFAICYLALVISRLLEHKLKYPISQIAESLNSVCGTLVNENIYVFDYCDELTEHIEKTMNIPLANRYLTPKEILNIVGNTKKP